MQDNKGLSLKGWHMELLNQQVIKWLREVKENGEKPEILTEEIVRKLMEQLQANNSRIKELSNKQRETDKRLEEFIEH
ncbi:hypothetical protein SAMN04490355_104217 [Pelosinus propionicus DSM 13327]|uniref:Uncharacterized protein n=2 Tax=Pelosinus TaxID=365348 RepID=A0A1I4N7W1_9FIRM|nr:hypothetical protein SAMN04490355_104217 [Pelosinus propionicus DSM 13327]